MPTRMDFERNIAAETARLSWPGRMGSIVSAGTKESLELHFVAQASNYLSSLLNPMPTTQKIFDDWHYRCSECIANFLRDGGWVKDNNDPSAVARKFLNTYVHQLMKYEEYRHVYRYVHLILDSQIKAPFARYARNVFVGKKGRDISKYVRALNPYKMSWGDYRQWQTYADELIQTTKNEERPLISKVELNYLWAQ